MPDPFQNPLLGTTPNGFGGSVPPSNALLPPNPYAVTPAEGWAANAQAAGDYLSQQRAQSAQMGFMNPNTGLPTQAGVADAAGRYTNMLLMGVKAPNAVPMNALMPQQLGPLAGIAQAVRNYVTKPNFARAASPDTMAAVQGAINAHPEIAHAVRSGDWSIAGDVPQVDQVGQSAPYAGMRGQQ